MEHSWTISPKEAIALQKALAAQVRIQPLPSGLKIIGGADISYSKHSDLLTAVILTFSWPGLDLLESVHHVCRATFPYVPGLLSFREVPPLVEAYRKIGQKPGVLLCDGQGIAHPRKLGFAAHLGLYLGIPTVGCAKSRLCGDHDSLTLKKGSSKPLILNGERIGLVFCSRDGVKPIYISPGHLCDITSSKKLISRCLRRYRIPEPLRLAHIEANRLRAAGEATDQGFALSTN
ncbi:MAG TPA: endonuclease V [Syntrophobacteraceae bacterium]|nr:endonuclease V [Syntrophobacteraceae bacterium]